MSSIGIAKGKIKPVANALNELLCDYSVYYQNLRTCHWNVKGQNFFTLHKEFERIYDDAKIKIDEIAERILTIGHEPISMMSKYVKNSNIPEIKSDLTDVLMVQTILKNQKTLIENMRKVIDKEDKFGDEGTLDLMSGLIADTEKRTWMLGAWLKD